MNIMVLLLLVVLVMAWIRFFKMDLLGLEAENIDLKDIDHNH